MKNLANFDNVINSIQELNINLERHLSGWGHNSFWILWVSIILTFITVSADYTFSFQNGMGKKDAYAGILQHKSTIFYPLYFFLSEHKTTTNKQLDFLIEYV